jgi:hypothetical protein
MFVYKEKRNIYLNSLALFLLSFFAVKASIIIVKLFVAWNFKIQTSLVNYRLIGISDADSGVWSFRSVYSFYSVELIVPVLIFIVSLISFRHFAKITVYRRVFYLWLGFAAMHSFFSAIMSGVVTQTNVFHFLQWMFVQRYMMMLMVFLLIPIPLVFGWIYNKQFIITSPIEDCNKLDHQRKVFLYGMFLPLLTGVLVLFAIVSFSFQKYDVYEFLLFISMSFPILLYFIPIHDYNSEPIYSENAKYKYLFIGIGICILLLVINIINT